MQSLDGHTASLQWPKANIVWPIKLVEMLSVLSWRQQLNLQEEQLCGIGLLINEIASHWYLHIQHQRNIRHCCSSQQATSQVLCCGLYLHQCPSRKHQLLLPGSLLCCYCDMQPKCSFFLPRISWLVWVQLLRIGVFGFGGEHHLICEPVLLHKPKKGWEICSRV